MYIIMCLVGTQGNGNTLYQSTRLTWHSLLTYNRRIYLQAQTKGEVICLAQSGPKM